MRLVIAGFGFDLNRDEVAKLMSEVEPEQGPGDRVTVGRHAYPVMQIGEVITGQDRRDFSAREVTCALGRLGFPVHTAG
ncbi:SCO5918 family protein [Yinghuangia soli]|uniref:SCO5918 family protein n=1 Tax=Yinghuangia soli TaxID=2908204 RepID=A0AA41U1L7_9ACTN|nr:SCO5918 family protein [Yinghuangia soli]MCF2529695.1 SCO5918 family protein [Yinghuangia soli]